MDKNTQNAVTYVAVGIILCYVLKEFNVVDKVSSLISRCMEPFSGVQFGVDHKYQRTPSVLQVHSTQYNPSVKMSTLSMPKHCVRNIATVDYTKFNADKHNIPNYHPNIGYDTRNVIHDNCLVNMNANNFGSDCNLNNSEVEGMANTNKCKRMCINRKYNGSPKTQKMKKIKCLKHCP